MPATSESVLTQVGAFVGGLIGGAAAAWAARRGGGPVFMRSGVARKSFAAGIHTQTAMLDIVRATGAIRVVLLAADVKQRVSTVVGEAHSEGAPDAAKLWQNTPIAPWYSAMVNGLVPNQPQTLVADEIPEGLLRDIYRSSGIVSSVVYLVARDGPRVVYLSVNMAREPGDPDADQRVAIVDAINRLRRHIPPGLGK